MAYQVFTTKELYNNILGQLSSGLDQTVSLLPKAFLKVEAFVLSGTYIMLWKYGGYIFKQMFVQTADNLDTEVNGIIVNPLKFWGRLAGIGDPTAATQAELAIDITVFTQGGSLASNTQLINSSTGVTYVTIGSTDLDAAIVPVTVRAVSDESGGNGAGTIGNLNPGDIITFANPIAAVDREAEVTAQTVTGANEEDTEVYRQRVLDAFQKTPQGGAYRDYELWGEEVEGILNVYPYTSDNPGQVDVYSEATVASSGNPDGIPTNAQLTAVLDSINFAPTGFAFGLASRRPATAFVNSLPITRTGFDVVVDGIVDVDDLATVEQNVTDALTEYFLSLEPFIEGLSITPADNRATLTTVSATIQDVVAAAGGTFTSVTMALTSGGGNITSYILQEGEKAKMTDIVFT